MNNFAPILIPTLNRHFHFKRCVESLSKCTFAEKTDLFIALDYPLKESHHEGYEIIKNYLPKITGFNSVNIIEREINFGARNNIDSAQKCIYERYDRLIFSEDDNEFAPNFLDYINQGLEIYRDDKNIFAICGYNHRAPMPKKYNLNIFCIQAFSAWGFGIWKNRWQSFIDLRNEKYYTYILSSSQLTFKLFKKEHRIVDYLLSDLKYHRISGDVLITAYLHLNKKYCLLPAVSKIRNHGMDGSGIHCSGNLHQLFEQQIIDTDKYFKYDDIIIEENASIINRYSKLWQKSIARRCYIVFRYVLFYCTGYIIDVKSTYYFFKYLFNGK